MAVQLSAKTARRLSAGKQKSRSHQSTRARRRRRHGIGDSQAGWPEPIKFVVPIKPRPKRRPRSARPITTSQIEKILAENGADHRTAAKRIVENIDRRHYTPKETRDFEKKIAVYARQNLAGKEPLNCPVSLTLIFEIEGDTTEAPTEERDADLDNLEKAAKDALNGIAYIDDRLVIESHKRKVCGPNPSVTVEVGPAVIHVTKGELSPACVA